MPFGREERNSSQRFSAALFGEAILHTCKKETRYEKLERFSAYTLAVLPTPIQKLENISRILGTNVYIKRDDLTGIGLGGNKVRKLEFLLADAKRQGAEIIFTTGGAQSNHAMLTAACAKKLGMTPILILKKRGVTERKGNQLLE